jgi:hypothetical protein
VNLAFGDLHGLQASAGGNYLQGALVGFQAAAGLNLALRGGLGVQAAAGANWARGDLHGAQLAAGFNGASGAVQGLQAGVVNYGHEIAGAQLGVVNVAEVSHGLQLGIVNISDEDHGVPIGLLSYARRNGIFRLDAYATETSAANVGLKIGGHHVYNSFAIGARPGREGNRFTASLGLGVRARVERPWLEFLDTELAASTFDHDFSVDHDRLQLLSSLRVLGGWRLAQRFAVFAGPTLNVLVRKRGLDDDLAPGALESVLHDGPTRVSIYPGLMAGIEI